ncbi:RNA-directed DNA polymerase [Ranunculus cassubicifolius]
MAKKKQRIPEVLWRLYGTRARTLAETIINLLPPSSSSKSRCRGCLRCTSSESDAMKFLIRSNDPANYIKLLTKSFAVISLNAPQFFGGSCCSNCKWSQKQIVKRTIEMIMQQGKGKDGSRNVICNGFNQCTQFSKVVELLTTSEWSLFHKRIGDELMVHLLKFVDIFLPHAHKNHQQVSGLSISDLCSKSLKDVRASQRVLPEASELSKKRKRTNAEDKFNFGVNICAQHSFGHDRSTGGVKCCVDDGQRNPIRRCRMPTSEENMPYSCISNRDGKTKSKRKFLQSSNKENVNPKKRAKQSSWQRRTKRRQLNSAEESITCSTITGEKDTNMESELDALTGFHPHSRTDNMLMLHKEPSLSVCSEMVPGHCFCLWMLQELQTIPGKTQVMRKSVFYKSERRSFLFPRSHILNISKANNTGAAAVFKDIFGLCAEKLISTFPNPHKCPFCMKESACLFHSIVKLIKRLIRKCRVCQYQKLLGKHCTVSTSIQIAAEENEAICEGTVLHTNLLDRSGTGVHNNQVPPQQRSMNTENITQQKSCQRTSRAYGRQFETNGSYCLKSQVVSFIWAVCRHIIPPELLGAPSNWRSLRKNIAKFVHLRKFEKFSLKQCMEGLKTSSVPLLAHSCSSCCLNSHDGCHKFSEGLALLKAKLFSCWVHWFFSHFVVPMLQANFYITDIEDGKLDVFYYRKSSWESLSKRGVSCLRNQSYRLLGQKDVMSILAKRPFGFSKVRFLPKENGMRVLANLKASSNLRVRQMSKKDEKIYTFKSVNYVLRDLNVVLKGLKVKFPQKLGSSVFDYNDIYKRLIPFIIGLKRGSLPMPSVFLVICDISKAFDFVNQDKLLSVMKDVMLDDEYLLELSSEVMCTNKSLWAHHRQMLSDRNMNTAPTTSTTFVPYHVLHRVRNDQVDSKTIGKAQLNAYLHQHVKGNVLQLARKFYLQEVGIPQGSVVSSLLCSYYLAHLERNVIFPFLEKVQAHHTSEKYEGDSSGQNLSESNNSTVECVEFNSSTAPRHLLLRFIDDFLFISTSLEQATSFFTRLQRGFRDYSCSINEAKSCTNFDVSHLSTRSLNKVYTGDDGISFLPWSGLLINSRTLEIQADYTRYIDTHLSSTLTVCCQDKPGSYLKEKLCHYMQPKCHPIFYDSNINSAPVVRLNIYQAFLLCSMKFHCYICNLSKAYALRAEQYFEMIIHSLRYMHGLIKSRMYSVKVGTSFQPILKLKKVEVIWLGLKAYIRVLKRKQSRHSELLSLLKAELLRSDVKESVSLKYAVDDSHSSLFWKIKY